MTLVRVIAATICTVLLAATSVGAAAQTFGVGTMSQGTITYSAGSAIAKVVSQQARLKLRVQPYTGTTQIVPLVNAGELDFTLANVLEASNAASGGAVFKGRANPELRVVAVIYRLFVGIFAREDSPYQRVSDLAGKRFPIGYTGQAMIAPVVEGVLAADGLGFGKVKGVAVPSIVRGADDFATGKAEAFFFGVGAGKVAEVAAKVGGLRLLKVDDTAAGLDRMRNLVPPSYFTTIKPSKRNVGVVEPTQVMTYDYLFLAGAHVSDDVVYEVTKTLHGNKKALAASFGLLNRFNPASMAKNLDVPYHPGAIRFYREAGLWPPKK